ncbi:MAG: prolipoprotein diacylglyceryl transferase [Chloroflexi bacterium]|nr:prolipoprotein diacylglyceryl transferase [Chloroflexota bacterium]
MISITDGFSIGILHFLWSGVLIAIGITAGFLFTIYEAKYRNYDPDIVYELFLPLIFWGTVGARIWHILTPPLSSVEIGLTTQYYFSHPLDALAIWIGGFGVPGAWIGGLFAVFLFARKNQLPLWELADLIAPGLALAHAIGRLGNFFNQELYGLPTDLPWRIFIDPAHRLLGYEAVQYYHPLFAYEVILNIVNLVVLLWLSRKFFYWLKAGDLFLIYIGLYSFFRFFLEIIRLDVALVNGININQIFFVFTFIYTVIVLFIKRRFPQKQIL